MRLSGAATAAAAAAATSTSGTPTDEQEHPAPERHAPALDRAADALSRLLDARPRRRPAAGPPRGAAVTSASPSTCADSGRPRRRVAGARRASTAPMATTSRTSGVPTVSVPVLSNNTVRARPSASIVPAPFTTTPPCAARERPETSAIGAARISGHGRRHDHDRQRTDRFAAQRPRGRRDDQRGGQEEPRVAVRHPHERRPLRLCLLDEPHESRVRALGGGPIRAYVERGTSVRGAAQHVHPRGQSDRAAAHR